ncbi:MAG: XapX domain-containing protein [Verrucomicrobiales bacterium]|jgi:XapX domain-containing protein
MQPVILALLAGYLVGIIFSFIKLPLPAPPVLPGVVGIVGIYMGGLSYQWVLEKWFS